MQWPATVGSRGLLTRPRARLERLSTVGDLYADLMADGVDEKQALFVVSCFAMMGDDEGEGDELTDEERWLDCQDVDLKRSRATHGLERIA